MNKLITTKKILQGIVNYKLTILTLAIIVFLSLSGSENINTPQFLNFRGADKLIHLGMYGFLTIIYLIERTQLLKGKIKMKRTRWFYVLWIVFIGGIIEIIQPIIAGREKDIWDFVSNGSGIIFAYLTFYIFSKYYKFNNISSS